LKKDFLKYLLISFLPVVFYGGVLLVLPTKPSVGFMLAVTLLIGLNAQVAFKKYVEKSQ